MNVDTRFLNVLVTKTLKKNNERELKNKPYVCHFLLSLVVPTETEEQRKKLNVNRRLRIKIHFFGFKLAIDSLS